MARQLSMDEKFTQRSDIDFLRRSMPGVIIYIVTWPLLCWSLDYYQLHPKLSITFTALFVSVSLLRIFHAYLTQFVYKSYPGVWRSTLYVLSLSHSLILSTLLIISVTTPQYDKVALPVIIMASAIGCGAVASLSVKYRFTQIYLASLVLPIIVTAHTTEQFQYLSIMFLVLWTYFFFLLRRYSKEYRRAFHIENELLENQKKLEALNITDALTGIFNRQYFDSSLDAQWELASRSQSNLSILFLDLDFFKKVNDKYGHLIGDKALCHAAELFQETTKRKSDMIARYGGEEFAIILPSTHHTDAMALAEHIREQLESTPLLIGERSIQLTVSIGVNTVIPSNNNNCMHFLDAADKALYEAKRSGRNKVVSVKDIATTE